MRNVIAIDSYIRIDWHSAVRAEEHSYSLKWGEED